MKIDTAIVTAMVGVVGVLLGATAQFLFAKRADVAKHYQDLQTQAYVDFLNSTAGIGIAQRYDRKDEEYTSTAALADSRSRIAIYGSKAVAKVAAHFFSEYGNLSSREAVSAYVEIARTMRSEVPVPRVVQRISAAVIEVLVIGGRTK
jgi:hypothetical protein